MHISWEHLSLALGITFAIAFRNPATKPAIFTCIISSRNRQRQLQRNVRRDLAILEVHAYCEILPLLQPDLVQLYTKLSMETYG
jgi:hypothetical protein